MSIPRSIAQSAIAVIANIIGAMLRSMMAFLIVIMAFVREDTGEHLLTDYHYENHAIVDFVIEQLELIESGLKITIQ